MDMSFMYLAVEDELSEAVGTRLIREFVSDTIDIQVLRRNGFGYLKTSLKKFSEIARNFAVLVITDLDRAECPVRLVQDWFQDVPKQDKLVFRVAVREIESWLLADRQQIATYLNVSEDIVPREPDDLPDPKAKLISLARRAPRELRTDIMPDRGSRSPQGLGYNRALSQFVIEQWGPLRAKENSESLSRACDRLIALSAHM